MSAAEKPGLEAARRKRGGRKGRHSSFDADAELPIPSAEERTHFLFKITIPQLIACSTLLRLNQFAIQVVRAMPATLASTLTLNSPSHLPINFVQRWEGKHFLDTDTIEA